MNIKLHIEKKHSHSILGITFRYMRLKEGYSLRDLGELVNMSHTLIANIETGKIIPTGDTLRDLLKVFHISYRDDEEIIREFETLYVHVIKGLFMYDYDSIINEIEYLTQHENTFIHSIVTLEYTLLLFLYSVLLDDFNKQQKEDLDLLLRVTSMMSDVQNQLLYLIVGINLYNQGKYYESYLNLERATKIGDTQIDPLIHLYMIRDQVKMYRFMDAQKLAEKTIKAFDEELAYARSMQVRLELASSHIHVRKFDDALEYLDKIELFGSQYKRQYFIDQGHIQRSIIHLMQGDIQHANDEICQVEHESTTTLFLQMVIGDALDNKEQVKQLYNTFYNKYNPTHRIREKAFMDAVIYEYGCADISEEEYVQRLERLVDISMEAHDQELLNHSFTSLIAYYKSKRMYKKALDLSETMRQIRSFGVFNK